MNSREREPTQDELLAMAYADGELSDEARADFERRLAQEPALLREVAELKKLEVIARHTAPREPMDYEWERLERGLVHPGGHFLGFFLALIGTLGLTGFGLYVFVTDPELELWAKVFIGLLLVGLATVFLVILRARLRTLPYDPYTEVKR